MLQLLAREDLANGIVAGIVSDLSSWKRSRMIAYGEFSTCNCQFTRSYEVGPRKLTIILVLGLIVLSSSWKSIVHSEAGEVLVAPSLGG